MQPKILIFSGYFYPHKGGSEEYMLKLCRFLSSKGILCEVITCNTEHVAKEETYQGIKIHRVDSWHLVGKKYPVPKPSAIKKVLGKLKTNYDFIFTNTRFFNIAVYAHPFAKKQKRAKLIHVEHGSKHTDNEGNFVRLVNFVYDKTVGKNVIKNADKVFAISEASRTFVKALSGKNSELAYNSIDTSVFERAHKNGMPLRKFYKAEGKFIVLYAGRLIEAKGVQDLIAACSDIDVELFILGSGNYAQALRQLAKNKKNIHFIEKSFNQKELIEAFGMTDVFVNPSYNEGLPTIVLEAGSFGLPIIATNVGSTWEIIEDGKNGFLIPVEQPKIIQEKILKLKKNKELRLKFSSEIQKKIKKKFDVSTAFMPILSYIRKNFNQ